MARILVITQRIPYPPNKGEKLRSFHQIEYLCKLGHSVTVISPREKLSDDKDAEALRNRLNIEVITDTMPSKFIRYLTGIIKGTSLSEANFYSRKIQTIIDKHSASSDVILCSASSLGKYVFACKHSNDADKQPLLLMDFMDVDSDKWSQYAQRSSWPMSLLYAREHCLIKRLEQKCIAHFDHAFIIADAEHALFQSSVAKCDNLHILGNGIDQTEFAPVTHRESANADADELRFLFTGVMDYKPNVDAVLWFVKHCWADIKQTTPKAKLIVAGMDPVAKISALSADPSIEITGFVEDIMPFFNQAHIFIAPFQISRGVQNKVLQAMSCGIPVVSTALGAEGIKAIHGSNMIIANTIDDFKNACIDLASNPSQRKTLGVNANTTINEYYSWEGVLSRLKQIIDENVVSDEATS